MTPLAPEEESSARGAALIAMVSAGIIPDLGATPDPAEICRPIEPIAANAPAYASARSRQAVLESLLFPPGGVWTDQIETSNN